MADDKPRVVAFSLHGKWATLSTGETVPVTNMFDVAHEETKDPDLCVTAVAGSDATKWFGFRVCDYDLAKLD